MEKCLDTQYVASKAEKTKWVAPTEMSTRESYDIPRRVTARGLFITFTSS